MESPEFYLSHREARLEQNKKFRRKKEELKICNICGKTKPLSDFYDHHLKYSDCHEYRCKACARKYHADNLKAKKAAKMYVKNFHDELVSKIHTSR